VGAKHVVESLLRFSRQEKPHKRSIQINSCISDVLNILRYRLTAGFITAETELADDLPDTFADGSQLEQVFMNILNNACDALEGSGGRIRIQSSHEKGFISVSIENDGPEIPEEIRSRIFDPFYTSKEVGRGTGLGLSLCHGIVQEHGGEIAFTSRPGKTVFTVRLPIVRTEDREGSALAGGGGLWVSPPSPRKRILVIDDEPDQLEVIQRILAGAYDVTACSSGVDAVRRLERGRFDLILSDVRMPDIDGVALYEWLKNHQPEMTRKILFSTGDVLGGKFAKVLKDSDPEYLLKPYNIEELLAKIRGMLAEDPGKS
jgi:CheY-like chemotaxis protein